jgi:hypothetical protein
MACCHPLPRKDLLGESSQTAVFINLIHPAPCMAVLAIIHRHSSQPDWAASTDSRMLWPSVAEYRILCPLEPPKGRSHLEQTFSPASVTLPAPWCSSRSRLNTGVLLDFKIELDGFAVCAGVGFLKRERLRTSLRWLTLRSSLRLGLKEREGSLEGSRRVSFYLDGFFNL